MARAKKDEKTTEKEKAGFSAKAQSVDKPASQEGKGKSQATPESALEEQKAAGAPSVEISPASDLPVKAPQVSLESPPASSIEPEKATGPKRFKIRNKAYAGMKVGARTGQIEFNEEGIAEVGPEDYALFKRVPGYEDVQ